MSIHTPIGSAPPPEAAKARPRSQEQLSVAEAKARLVETLRSIDLLRPLRDHPFVVVGAAATAGAVLGSSGTTVNHLSRLSVSLLRLAKPVSGILTQFLAGKAAADAVTTRNTSAKTDTVPEAPIAEGTVDVESTT